MQTRQAGGVNAELIRSLAYTAQGIALVRRHLGFYLLATVVYASPAIAAAILALRRDELLGHEIALLVALPWVTALLGTTVIMVAMSAHSHGESITLGRASWLGITWLPRYAWTNAHTTPVFWIPITLAVAVLQAAVAAAGAIGWLLAPLIAILAVLLHVRTLLAPFFAVHGNLGATRAAWTAWAASARSYTVCLVTFLLAAAPAAVVVAIGVGVYFTVDPGGLARAFGLATGELTAAAIQVVRPILIASLFFLFRDIELTLPATGSPLPSILLPLAALTRPLPHLGKPISAA